MKNGTRAPLAVRIGPPRPVCGCFRFGRLRYASHEVSLKTDEIRRYTDALTGETGPLDPFTGSFGPETPETPHTKHAIKTDVVPGKNHGRCPSTGPRPSPARPGPVLPGPARPRLHENEIFWFGCSSFMSSKKLVKFRAKPRSFDGVNKKL